VLGLHSFDLKEFLMMAPQCRYMYDINTCYELHFIKAHMLVAILIV